jgi:hypothetical protein
MQNLNYLLFDHPIFLFLDSNKTKVLTEVVQAFELLAKLQGKAHGAQKHANARDIFPVHAYI